MSCFVCLTVAEWKNLCSDGSLRLLQKRAVAEGAKPISFDLFRFSPDRFSTGESADLIIAELADDWSMSYQDSDLCTANECALLVFDDVVEFFPLQEKDRWVFEPDAEKIGVQLAGSRFESLWVEWTRAEQSRIAIYNGVRLAQICGVWTSLPFMDGMEWNPLAPLLEPIDDSSLHVATLIQKRDELFNLCREDSDYSSFMVSCSVEWVSLCQANGNVLDNASGFVEMAQGLHDALREERFDPAKIATGTLVEFFQALFDAAPTSFDTIWKPATICLYVRYFHRVTFCEPTPDEIVSVIQVSKTIDGQESACALAFLLGSAMSSNKVQSIARQIKMPIVAVSEHQKSSSGSINCNT